MMRKWLAGKLFDLAVWLDWDAVLLKSVFVLMANLRFAPDAPEKKKRGRPLGAKDKKPRDKKNMGRPKGSKNQSKA